MALNHIVNDSKNVFFAQPFPMKFRSYAKQGFWKRSQQNINSLILFYSKSLSGFLVESNAVFWEIWGDVSYCYHLLATVIYVYSVGTVNAEKTGGFIAEYSDSAAASCNH